MWNQFDTLKELKNHLNFQISTEKKMFFDYNSRNWYVEHLRDHRNKPYPSKALSWSKMVFFFHRSIIQEYTLSRQKSEHDEILWYCEFYYNSVFIDVPFNKLFKVSAAIANILAVFIKWKKKFHWLAFERWSDFGNVSNVLKENWENFVKHTKTPKNRPK